MNTLRSLLRVEKKINRITETIQKKGEKTKFNQKTILRLHKLTVELRNIRRELNGYFDSLSEEIRIVRNNLNIS